MLEALLIGWSCWAIGRYFTELGKAVNDDSSEYYIRTKGPQRPRHPNGKLKRDKNGNLLPMVKK